MIIIQDFLPLCMVFSQIQNGDIEIAFHIMFFVYGIKKHIRHIMRGSRFLPGRGGGRGGWVGGGRWVFELAREVRCIFSAFLQCKFNIFEFSSGGGGMSIRTTPSPYPPSRSTHAHDLL